MKTVLSHEYNTKKILADNILIAIANKYKNISDSEFQRINDAIDTYIQSSQNEFDYLHNISQNNQENTTIISRIEQLEDLVANFHDNDIVDVEESGLYFTDEDGYIVAKITNLGFFAINIDQTNNSGSGSSSISGDLTVIDY